jgi:hypothetical protein
MVWCSYAASRASGALPISERRWIVVGWVGPEVAHGVGPPGHASIPILSAFGGDAVGPVLRAGAPPCGHPRGPVDAGVERRVSFDCRHTAGGHAQAGKQQRAARCGDIGSPRRRGQNHCPVGQLLITPTPKRFHQVMGAAAALEVGDESGIYPLAQRVRVVPESRRFGFAVPADSAMPFGAG